MVHIPELNNDSNENTAVRPDIELNARIYPENGHCVTNLTVTPSFVLWVVEMKDFL